MSSDRLTSEEMDRLLTRLGFCQVPSEGPQRVFEDSAFDAVLLLPRAGKETFARPEHLITLRKTVIEKGITDEDTFETMLNEVRLNSVNKMVKVS